MEILFDVILPFFLIFSMFFLFGLISFCIINSSKFYQIGLTEMEILVGFFCFFLYSDSLRMPVNEIYGELDFYPIINITVSNENVTNFLHLEFLNDRKYSLIKKGRFTKECLTNYFINELNECPITDIVLENNKSLTHKGYAEIKLSQDEYLYFSNKNKYGRLYKEDNINGNHSFPKNKDFIIETKYHYDSKSFREKKSFEDLKKSHSFKGYYYYIKYVYIVTNTLIFFFLIFYYYIISPNPRIFSYFKIIIYSFEIMILIIYLFGLFLYIKVNNILEKEKEKYNYSLFKMIDDFLGEIMLISYQTAKILTEILYLLFPDKCQCDNAHDYVGDDWVAKYMFWRNNGDSKKRLFYLFLPISIGYFMLVSINIIYNSLQYNNKYDFLASNWKSNPISSIKIISNNDYELEKEKDESTIYQWRNSLIKIKRLKEFNYYNIYKKENGKICGKDSFGDNLYFPEDIECPINEIIITKYSDMKGYNKLLLGDNLTYLYYTNKKIEKKIIIDIINGTQYYYSRNYYEKIDEERRFFFLFSPGPIILNSISYLGINSNNIKKRENIEDFKDNFKIFWGLEKSKKIRIILFLLSFVVLYIFLLIKNNNKVEFFISLLILLSVFCIIMIELVVIIIYITNFMDIIDQIFQTDKSDYIFSLYLLAYEIILFLCLLSINIFTFWFKENSLFKCKRETQINNREVIINDNNNSVREQFQIEQQQTSQSQIVPNETQENISNQNDILRINNQNESQHKCIYCLINETKIILYPCRHRCCCETCYKNLKNTPNDIKNCPICRKTVIEVIDQIYDV